MKYYQFEKPLVKLSTFLTLSKERKQEMLIQLNLKPKNVIVYAFCLMPNHFHLLVEQKINNGLKIFLSNFQNSYTKYFNKKQERDGPILKGRFQAKRIETDEQLLHVSRYIHLNPYTSVLVKNYDELLNYPWSSLSSYLSENSSFIDTNRILSFFKNTNRFKEFTLNQAEYQKRLKDIQHLILDNY